jgi:S1-C subfamily serine protease
VAERKRILVGAAGLGAAAASGAALALGGTALLGGFGGGETTTVREVAPPPLGGGGVSGARERERFSAGAIYRLAASGVVQVRAAPPFELAPRPLTTATRTTSRSAPPDTVGSGFVIDKSGHIVTSYRIVRGAARISVSFSNDERLPAVLVGADPATDVAVLKISTRSRALSPLQFGDSDDVRVGDDVAALGNPFGHDRTVTAGIVSALQRGVKTAEGLDIGQAIQTDAEVTRRADGGPLLDAQGQVVGLNSRLHTGNPGDGPVAAAIPANTVKPVVAQLVDGRKVEHVFAGIHATAVTRQLSQIFRLPVEHGLLVEEVDGGSGAARAGLRGGSKQVMLAGSSYTLGGDIILDADHQAMATPAQLTDLIASKRPGDALTLHVYRGTSEVTLRVKLGQKPVARPRRGAAP